MTGVGVKLGFHPPRDSHVVMGGVDWRDARERDTRGDALSLSNYPKLNRLQGREEEETNIHLLLSERLEVVLDLLATDGLGGELGAVAFTPERKADDRSWESALTLIPPEPGNVQGIYDLGRDILQRDFRLAFIEEISLGVDHDHSILRNDLWIVRDLEIV